MAILNGLYIHVTDESMEREVQATSHPVEEGLPITDTVRVKSLSISLSGKIVDYGNKKAAEVLSTLIRWHEGGTLLSYQGRNVASNMQIRAFESSHPNTNSGGADFTMTLEHVRIAKSAYVPKKSGDTARNNTAKANPAISVGATVVFKGGPVYVSSDAKKAAATRGRSTCKCTIISTQAWSIHPYHLISSDGGKVYGWVDKANVEAVPATSTSGKTNAGTQQTKSSSSKSSSSKSTASTGKVYPVYHKVKSGDTVYSIASKYKYLGKSVSWIIDCNSSAFTESGALKVGAYMIVGYKQ